jgi:hypothetical protein
MTKKLEYFSFLTNFLGCNSFFLFLKRKKHFTKNSCKDISIILPIRCFSSDFKVKVIWKELEKRTHKVSRTVGQNKTWTYLNYDIIHSCCSLVTDDSARTFHFAALNRIFSYNFWHFKSIFIIICFSHLFLTTRSLYQVLIAVLGFKHCNIIKIKWKLAN